MRWQGAGRADDTGRPGNDAPPASTRRDVYVYFDNDHSGFAPRDALTLRDLIGPPPGAAV